MPAHALLVHAIVELVTLTAMLEILCAIWPAARRRLAWLVLAFAVAVMVFTPLTIQAGEWLFDQQSRPRAILKTHQARGEWTIYIAAALLIVAIVQVVQHRKQARSAEPRRTLTVVALVLALVVGIGSTVGMVLIGDSGAQSVWGQRK